MKTHQVSRVATPPPNSQECFVNFLWGSEEDYRLLGIHSWVPAISSMAAGRTNEKEAEAGECV